MRYIPVKEVHGEYISLNRLMGFRARIFGVVGARGYGKTYGFKRSSIKRYKYGGKRMTVLRDTKDAADKVCEAHGSKFFGDVMAARPFADHDEARIENREIFINKQSAGEVLSLSEFYKYKGNAFNSDSILFDEFIAERQQIRRGDPAYAFVQTIETILRDRQEAVVYLTANALDTGNEILELFGLDIRQKKYGYYYNPDKEVCIYYAPNSPEFEERRKNSLSYKLAKGTRFESTMINNEFAGIEPKFFDRREPCELQGIFHTINDEPFRLYKSKVSGTYYATRDPNPDKVNYMRYTFELSNVSPDRRYAPDETKKLLKFLLANRRVEFENKYILTKYLSVIDEI